MADDARSFAAAAGLDYTESEQSPAIWRKRWGRGFTYVTDSGERLPRRHPRRQQILELAVPPAWEGVWITPLPEGHLQATGYDSAGRKQYRYHPRWSQARRVWHDQHLLAFGHALPGLRAQVARILTDANRPTYDTIHAAAVRLLDLAAPRVGNPESVRRFDTRGLTTLTTDEVDLGRRRVQLTFLGKGRIEREVSVRDPALARVLRQAESHDDDHLFSWREGGEEGHVTGASLNAFLRELSVDAVHAHLFRSWHASVGALQAVDAMRPGDSLVDALTPVAERLGHTVSTCRSHYVHHLIEPAYDAGELATVPAPPIPGLTAAECRLMGCLDGGPLASQDRSRLAAK